MQNSTRVLYQAYLGQLAAINSVAVDSLDKKFSVSPSIEQKLESKIQESSEFLKKINIYPVSQQEGEKIGMGVSGPISSSTNTVTTDRQTVDLSTLDAMQYRCEQTNFDTHLRYQQIDAWAKFPDFQTRLRDVLIRRQALDRICVGFNGTSRAVTTNRQTSPLLQDLNKGWLQHYREKAAARVMTAPTVGAASGGVAADYANLDSLVFDMVNSLLDPWHSESPDLVVICGREIVKDKYFPVLNAASNQPNSERLAADVIMSSQRIGSLPAITVPFFPANSVMVTTLANLSIYWQEGTRRRSIVENAKRDRVENYDSVNEGYVVEDFGAGCVAEGIVIR